MFFQTLIGAVLFCTLQANSKSLLPNAETLALSPDLAPPQSYPEMDMESLMEMTEAHSRRKRSLDDDACHLLASKDLPESRDAVHAAWNNSTSFVLKVTTAVDNMKECPGWNVVGMAVCFIKGAVEVYRSYGAYKPQIYNLITKIDENLTSVKGNFVNCSKILLLSR